MKKRVISFLLMLIGIFIILPSALVAEERIEAHIGDREYTSIVEALEAANHDDTVELPEYPDLTNGESLYVKDGSTLDGGHRKIWTYNKKGTSHLSRRQYHYQGYIFIHMIKLIVASMP